ncbi:MAG: pilus assembly protein PilP [Thermodesulfobacteriota bacterium]
MKNFFKISLIIVAASFFLSACSGGGGGDESSSVRMKPAKKPAPPKVAVKKEEVKKEVKKVATTFNLDRNPFKSYIIKKTVKMDTRIKGPLECCQLQLFKLLAVISGIDEPKALVLAPDGKKYSLKLGDLIGLKEGKILEINPEGLVIEETLVDFEGKKSLKKAVLALPVEGNRYILKK